MTNSRIKQWFPGPEVPRPLSVVPTATQETTWHLQVVLDSDAMTADIPLFSLAVEEGCLVIQADRLNPHVKWRVKVSTPT